MYERDSISQGQKGRVIAARVSDKSGISREEINIF
jgi:hypothetical protein